MLEAEDDPPKASSTSDASAQEIDQNSDPHLGNFHAALEMGRLFFKKKKLLLYETFCIHRIFHMD